MEETFCNRRGDILWSRHFVIGEETFCGENVLYQETLYGETFSDRERFASRNIV